MPLDWTTELTSRAVRTSLPPALNLDRFVPIESALLHPRVHGEACDLHGPVAHQDPLEVRLRGDDVERLRRRGLETDPLGPEREATEPLELEEEATGLVGERRTDALAVQIEERDQGHPTGDPRSPRRVPRR